MLDYLEKHPEGNADHTEWLKHIDEKRVPAEFVKPVKGTVNPKEFLQRLSERMPADVNICADVGQKPDMDKQISVQKGRPLPDIRRNGYYGIFSALCHRR